jgi:hypothetical protein
LLGIGAAIAGLAYLWKNHSETIKKWAKKFGDFVGKVIDFMALFNPVFAAIKWLKDNWEHRPKWLGGDGGAGTVGGRSSNYKFGSKKTGATLREGITDKSGHIDASKVDWEAANREKAVYGDLGQIVNLGKMTKEQGAREIARDIAAKGNKSFYQYVTDDSIVDKASFGTDIADKGGVYLARGVVEEFLKFKEKLEKEGYDTSKMKITSGIGSVGSYDTRAVSPHSYSDSIYGHFSSLGTTIDTGTIFHKGTGKRLSKGDMQGLGYGTWHLYNEGAGHQDHEHLSMKMIPQQQMLKKAVAESEKEQQVSVMVGTANLLKYANKDKYEAITAYADAQHMSDKARDNMYKDALKREGYEIAEGIVGKPWMKDGAPVQSTVTKENGGLFFTDPTGIKSFSAEQLQQLSNGGSGGN